MTDLPFMKLPPQAPINIRADAYGETALRLSRLAAMTTRCELDIPYGAGKAQRLDIYLPAGTGRRDLPVFINIHGGGWMAGYKEWMGLNAPAIVAAPAVYVSIEYTLAPAKHPAQIDDCVAALAWVHSNIARFGGSPNRIFVGGHSAGGHLSALMTLRRDLLAKAGLPENVIKACFPYSGVYDLRDLKVYGQTNKMSPANVILDTPELALDASPIAWVADNRTPFFVTWGENDNVLCHAEGPAFVLALRDHGTRVEDYMYPTFDHFWVHLNQLSSSSIWTRTLLAWMNGDPRTTPAAPASA